MKEMLHEHGERGEREANGGRTGDKDAWMQGGNAASDGMGMAQMLMWHMTHVHANTWDMYPTDRG